MLFALRDTIVFFHTPKEVAEKHIPAGKRIRLGGLVAEGSVKRGAGTTVEFAVTDTADHPRQLHGHPARSLPRGPGRGGRGQARLPAARFLADTVLAKHDENYMPPEVAKALKEQGVWQSGGEGRCRNDMRYEGAAAASPHVWREAVRPQIPVISPALETPAT